MRKLLIQKKSRRGSSVRGVRGMDPVPAQVGVRVGASLGGHVHGLVPNSPCLRARHVLVEVVEASRATARLQRLRYVCETTSQRRKFRSRNSIILLRFLETKLQRRSGDDGDERRAPRSDLRRDSSCHCEWSGLWE
jgi:hypothetical protein